MCSIKIDGVEMTSTKTSGEEIDKTISHNILQHYVIEKWIGKGAYGVVWKAQKRNTNQLVAIKKIFKAFRNKEDAQRTFREVTYLKAFKGHPNIINLLSIHRASNNSDIYLVFEYMDIDLYKYINSGNKLDNTQVRFIVFQILKALKYIHSGKVIHRDLKPSNVLLNVDCSCKIADFGLARSIGETRPSVKSPLTDYVATRWYRAPEILLGAKRYTEVVDTWSLGCVVGEMLTGIPLFRGDNTTDQLGLIMSSVVQDNEDNEVLERLGVGRPPAGRRTPLWERLESANPDCIDFVSKLLKLDPAHRLTAQQGLRHPYICKYRSLRGEPILRAPVHSRISDNSRLTVHDYRSALYNYEDQKPRGILPSYLPGVNRTHIARNNVLPKAFSSDPETFNYKTRVNENTRYPLLTCKTYPRGNCQSKGLRH